MANPVEDDYWGNVRDAWSQAVADANGGFANRSVTARQEHLPRFGTERIAVTGMRGAGKSVIYKALVGQTGEHYTKTRESKRVERGRIKIAGAGARLRAKVSVLPGQRNSKPRQRELERLFRHGNYPLGVIHVANWGFEEVWDPDGRSQILKTLDRLGKPRNLSGVCEHLRTTQELEDFIRTSRFLKEAWAGMTDEIWLIIAVAKCDLYWDQIDDVGKYYIPGVDPDNDSPFAAALRLLIEQLDLPKFAVLPVSCVSDPFEFVGRLRAGSGKFNDEWRTALTSNLLNTIGGFNEQ